MVLVLPKTLNFLVYFAIVSEHSFYYFCPDNLEIVENWEAIDCLLLNTIWSILVEGVCLDFSQ